MEFEYPDTVQSFHSFMQQFIFRYGKIWKSSSGSSHELHFDPKLQNANQVVWTVWKRESFGAVAQGTATILASRSPGTDRTTVSFLDGIYIFIPGIYIYSPGMEFDDFVIPPSFTSRTGSAPERKICDPIGEDLNELAKLIEEMSKPGNGNASGPDGRNIPSKPEPNEIPAELLDQKAMRQHYKDYNLQSARKIIENLPVAQKEAGYQLERLTVTRLANEAGFSVGTTSRYLTAIKKAGYDTLLGVKLPGR